MIYFASTIRALEAQIADLRGRLDKADEERKALLDRLLVRHNYESIAPAQPPAHGNSTIQVISPYGTIPPEAVESLKESWIQEETAWIQQTQGIDREQAMTEAERAYIEQHRTRN